MAKSPFHPDLQHQWAFKQAVTPLTLGPYRLLLAAGGLAMGHGVEKATAKSGQQIWVFRPEGAAARNGPHPALLWIHGGGLIFGHPLTELDFARAVCEELGAVVALPFYRFAPENPYPAALNDVSDALDWLAGQPDVDPDRIAIGGDSAGGGLAACLAIHARDTDGPKISFQLLHEPMLDDQTRFRTPPNPADLRNWSHGLNTWAWDGYLADVTGDVPATASAGRLTDATGLPPAFVGVGTHDLFHDEATRYVDLLDGAGVEVTYEEVAGAFHGFTTSAAKVPLSCDYVAQMKAALARAWAQD